MADAIPHKEAEKWQRYRNLLCRTCTSAMRFGERNFSTGGYNNLAHDASRNDWPRSEIRRGVDAWNILLVAIEGDQKDRWLWFLEALVFWIDRTCVTNEHSPRNFPTIGNWEIAIHYEQIVPNRQIFATLRQRRDSKYNGPLQDSWHYSYECIRHSIQVQLTIFMKIRRYWWRNYVLILVQNIPRRWNHV